MWGYLVLIYLAILINFSIQNIAATNLIQVAVGGTNGMLDLLFQKILRLSNSAKNASASGNIANLLFTDTQKVATMFIYVEAMFELPVGLAAYLIYIGVQITPIALTGMLGYLFFLVLVCLMLKQQYSY